MRLSLRATKNWASTPPKRKTKPPAPMDKVEFRYLCAVLKIVDNETAAELLGPSGGPVNATGTANSPRPTRWRGCSGWRRKPARHTPSCANLSTLLP